MDMKKITAGKLRAIGYDARTRALRVEFDDGSAIDYANVGNDLWRRFSTSGSAWSFYRDNIEEEFAGTRGRAGVDSKRAELDALFGEGGAAETKKPNPLDALFGEGGDAAATQSKPNPLDALFGGDGDATPAPKKPNPLDALFGEGGDAGAAPTKANPLDALFKPPGEE